MRLNAQTMTMIRTTARRILRAALPSALLALAACSSDPLGPSASSTGVEAKPAAAAVRVSPPVEMAGRWTLASASGGACSMNFGASTGAAEGTIAPEGGCPGNFFTSRKWTFEQTGLVIRDHTGKPLAQLAAAGPTRFEGRASEGAGITLSR
jgi:hypothetical protein